MESLAIVRCLRDHAFSRFGTVPACDTWQTDRRTDRHDDSISYRANIVSRGKNWTKWLAKSYRELICSTTRRVSVFTRCVCSALQPPLRIASFRHLAVSCWAWSLPRQRRRLAGSRTDKQSASAAALTQSSSRRRPWWRRRHNQTSLWTGLQRDGVVVAQQRRRRRQSGLARCTSACTSSSLSTHMQFDQCQQRCAVQSPADTASVQPPPPRCSCLPCSPAPPPASTPLTFFTSSSLPGCFIKTCGRCGLARRGAHGQHGSYWRSGGCC